MTTDLFADKATDWDTRPVPLQISEGVFSALKAAVPLREDLTVMDFGAGTGLVAGRIAPHVGHIVAVDISEAMLAQLAAKPELAGKVEIVRQDLLETPLDRRFDLIVSAMAMHHVEDTAALLRTLYAHLAPGGKVAIADLDTEPGDFHPADIEGVYHHGFDRAALTALFEAAGFDDVKIDGACEVAKEGRPYGVFLATATRNAA